MFRVLSEEEAQRVTRWKAPELKGTVPVARTRQIATPVRLGEKATARLPASSTEGGIGFTPETHAAGRLRGSETADSAPDSVPATTTIPLSNPSADMLQSSYDEGYARGVTDGQAQLQQGSAQQLQALIATLGQPALKVPDAELEQEVLALAVEIARVILGRELQQDPRSMAELVSRGIEHLPDAGAAPVQVHLHPEDVAMLEAFVEWPDNVSMVADDALRRSDCRVISGSSTVHAGKDDWLAVVRAELGVLAEPLQTD